MKRKLAPVVLVLVLVACATNLETRAYQTVGTIAVSVEAARQSYVALYDAGKITPAVKAKVESAYADYQKAMLSVQAGIVTYKTAATQANSDVLQSALLALQAAANIFLSAARGTP